MKKNKKSAVARRELSYDIGDTGKVYRKRSQITCPQDLRYPVCPFSVSDLTRWDGNWIRHVNYQHIAVEMVLDGAIKFIDGAREITVGAGEVFVIVPHSNVKIVNAAPGEARRKLAVLISGNAPGVICQSLGFLGDEWLRLREPREIERLIREIGEMIARKDMGRASDLAYSLLRCLAEEKRAGAHHEIPSEFQELIHFIDNRIASPLTVEDMAAFLNCSVSTLQRRFKKYYSVSPQSFLCNQRLELARSLLATTPVPVKEVAFQCGFCSHRYFGQAFRKRFCISPSQYRKKCGIKEDVENSALSGNTADRE